MVPIPATLFSLQACTYSLIGGEGRRGSPQPVDRGRENSDLVRTAVALQPLSGTSLKDSNEEKFSLWVELQAVRQVNSAWKEKLPDMQSCTNSLAVVNSVTRLIRGFQPMCCKNFYNMQYLTI